MSRATVVEGSRPKRIFTSGFRFSVLSRNMHSCQSPVPMESKYTACDQRTRTYSLEPVSRPIGSERAFWQKEINHFARTHFQLDSILPLGPTGKGRCGAPIEGSNLYSSGFAAMRKGLQIKGELWIDDNIRIMEASWLLG